MNLDEKSRLYPERSQGKSFPVTTPLEKVLLIIVAVVLLVTIALTISLLNTQQWKHDYKKNAKLQEECNKTILQNDSNVCNTPSCIYEAASLLKSMDVSVDPCTDFYSFVCGNWIKNNHLISELESQFTKLARNIVLRVKEILEDLAERKNLPENKNKMVQLYNSCIDEDKRNREGAAELLTDLKKFGGWPLIDKEWDGSQFDWAELMILLFRNGYMNSMLFSIKVDVDVKNTSQTILTVTLPTLGLIKSSYYTPAFDDLIISYEYVLYTLAKKLNVDIEQENTIVEILDAVEIEKVIANLVKDVDMRLPDTFYNIMTLEELATFAPMIPWKKLFRNLLPPGTEITDNERIMVTSPTLIKGLNSILGAVENNKAGRRALANYMFYRVVFSAANFLSRDFFGLLSKISGSEKVGSAMPWQICTQVVLELFPLPLTASYVTKYSGENTKRLLEEMLDDLKKALVENIKNANWLDKKTRNYALLKVRKMEAAIGYEDEIMEDSNLDSYYKNVNITDNYYGNIKEMIAFRLKKSMEGLHETRSRFEWTEVNNLLSANAYYRPSENFIIIPVGVLQETFFAAGRPNYINYGSLGMIVGHELTHAFDSIGSLYDADGNYRMWWTTKSFENFKRRMKCYVDQYDNYYMKDVETFVNGTLTLGENIADNGGIQTAYNAYKALLKRTGPEKSLPGLPYNEKQMFWISFASVWCRKQTHESIEYSLKHSVHTPSKFRITGSLSNMQEFSEDFNCKRNSKMNPASKCSLWNNLY